MKGNNKLTFNTATMIEAVQEYLDKRFVETGLVRVTNVVETNTHGCSMYEVSVTDEQEPQP